MTIKHLNDISAIPTSHGCGEKRVLASNEETVSAITQIAETVLHKGETAEAHTHETMEEFFYILDGEVKFLTLSGNVVCRKGDFVLLKPNELHGLVALSDTEMLSIGCAI